MSPRPADGYVDVSTRIQRFYEAYPSGNLETYRDPELLHVGERTFLVYAAAAYRTPDDKRPAIGWAWEPVPGPTPFTRDSELQNAETAAWGRAIAALGFEIRDGISTQQDVEARQESSESQPEKPVSSGLVTEKQHALIGALIDELELRWPTQPGQLSWVAQAREHSKVASRADLTTEQASNLITWLQEQKANMEVPFG